MHLHCLCSGLPGLVLPQGGQAQRPKAGQWPDMAAPTFSLHVIGRDVKLDNLLLVSPGDISHIKIADFGFAKKLHGGRGNAMQTVCGTSGAQRSALD